eukprot:3607060-Prymnesium_polylepis.1
MHTWRGPVRGPSGQFGVCGCAPPPPHTVQGLGRPSLEHSRSTSRHSLKPSRPACGASAPWGRSHSRSRTRRPPRRDRSAPSPTPHHHR